MYAYFTFYTVLATCTLISILISIITPWALIFLLLPVSIAIMNRFRCFRVRCRSWSLNRAPSTEKGLFEACKGNVTVVGHAWSFFLQRKTPENPVFTHNFISTRPKNGFWKAGTTIHTVSNYYEKEDRAFPSTPSYQNITLGGWIMTKSHGSSGDTGTGSSATFDEVSYLPKNSTKLTTVEYKDLNLSDVKCIFYVSFKDLIKNIWLRKIKVNSFEEWIRPEAYQRTCFVGQKQDVMVRWEEVTDKDYNIKMNRDKGFHVDPHCCSRFCLWFQADVCTACYKYTEKNKKFQSYVRLAEVNRFVPYIFPLLTLFVQDIINFEIIIETPQDIQAYYKKIKTFHRKHGGRTEIRYGKVLFLDVSVEKKHLNKYPFTGKYHKGKHIGPLATLGSMKVGNFKFKL